MPQARIILSKLPSPRQIACFMLQTSPPNAKMPLLSVPPLAFVISVLGDLGSTSGYRRVVCCRRRHPLEAPCRQRHGRALVFLRVLICLERPLYYHLISCLAHLKHLMS